MIDMNVNEAASPVKKISSIFMMVIIVMLGLSIAALYQALMAYQKGELDMASVLLSLSAIAISVYMLLQMRRKPLRLGFEMPEVTTTIECIKCSFKETRGFQRGDYILKEVKSCPKCNEKMIITSILRKVKKEK